RQAPRKFSTLRLHLAMVSLGCQRQALTTAGDGTWMLATERGRTWLARWQSTTPSISEGPSSGGKLTFSRLSITCREAIPARNSSCSSRAFSRPLRMVKWGSGPTARALRGGV
ncbi:unnamed protein product, partial [Ixodes pacificus]